MDHQPPNISIVTVVRNGREFIAQTIDSVLAQDYPDIEYIVIDGNSTDGTQDVIRAKESRISQWISEKDDGIADAFNKGLARTHGDYILFLNADDALCSSNVVSKMVQEIQTHQSPTLIYGDFDILNRETSEVLYRGKIDLTPKGLLRGQILPHPCLFTHRRYFDRYGGFDASFRIAMDYDWLLRGGLKETIVHVPIHVSNIRDGGISTQDNQDVVNEIIRALQKNGHHDSWLGGLALRGYFASRALARKFLTQLGLYRLFFNLRNKIIHG